MLSKEELEAKVKENRDKATRAAKKALKTYLEYWKIPDYAKMLEVSQITYKQNNPSNKNMLDYVGKKRLISFSIVSSELIKSGAACDFVVNVVYEIGKETRRMVLPKVRVICESGYFRPSTSGTWGVNPISTYKEEKQKKRKARRVEDEQN